MTSTTRANRIRQLVRGFGSIAAWGWTLLAGIGGLGLIITMGPWQPTNGWFALFSGLSACPLTAWLLKKCAAIRSPAGLVLRCRPFYYWRTAYAKDRGQGTFLPDFSLSIIGTSIKELSRRPLSVSCGHPFQSFATCKSTDGSGDESASDENRQCSARCSPGIA